ncbi:MAG: hypothetical protein A3G18_02665 [Rhodospirillales bacterium RIFCSPLOWO2_12_FULL_58_28]|nr:MAG: hypothetical protein A3G18_02665 [Rhodospirillales bacterium RIFCSPLOWO2_12_FULL_58_28]
MSALLMIGGDQAAIAEDSSPSFFNSKETPSANLEPFKKWNEALERYSKEVAEKNKGDCKTAKLNKCHFQEWEVFLESIRGKDQMTQINEVNRVMNKAKYIADETNWGEKDYWASPGEFMARFGDCEDYAISKYMSLKVLGFKQDQIRVVAVKDLNLKVGHAILVVFLDNKVYVLDNQIKQVVEAQTIRHYQPVFSINDKKWWRHNA